MHNEQPDEKTIFVLTSNQLHKWELIKDEDFDRLFYNCDLEKVAKTAFAKNVWVSNLF